MDAPEQSISLCHEEDMLELAIHRNFMSLVIKYSIFS